MARILIADDEDLERTALRFIINGSGLEPEFRIDEARNGHEALELGRSGSYDIIFLDIKMPGLDGLRTAEELRKAGILTPIVIISAFDTFEYAQKAIRLGVYEYLLKPAGADEVISALRRSLEWSREPESLSRKRDESISAISGAIKRLEASLAAQMKSGSLDEAATREFENLSSLEGLSRSVIVFRIHAAPGSSPQTLGNALVGMALGSVEKAVRRARKIIAAEDGENGFILIYGLGAGAVASDAVEAAGADSPDRDHGLVSGGFLRNLRNDPLWPIVDEAGRKLRDSVPCLMLCGLAGPSRDDTGILFTRALEGCRLASADCPVVRLAPLPGRRDGDLMYIYANDSNPRSLGMKALDCIKSGYSKELTLVSTAEKLGVNSYHLSHAISKELGIGFCELLSRVRINRAKELMMGGASVKEASYLVGFSDQAYFTRVFRKIEGMNPKQYIELTAKKYKK